MYLPEPNKETAMLCDIQYVRENKKEKIPDYLYIIWRDLESGKKYLKTIENPTIDIYFEKPEFRNHAHNKNYARLEEVEKRTVKYTEITKAIAQDMGQEGQNILNTAYHTGDFSKLQYLKLYPYVYGADYDIVAWYRIQWLKNFDNDIPKKLQKGFLDIEVDGIEVSGMPSPKTCPVNAVTIIDDYHKDVYTFMLIDRPYVSRDLSSEEEQKRQSMYENMHKAQHHMRDHQQEFIEELHEAFDESYGKLNYRLYFYTDEKKMLIHIFELINNLKLDIIGIWNIAFDIPYLMERMEALGLDPKIVMSGKDFIAKQCYFKKDYRNHEVKNKSDSFLCTSYSVFYDQMELYASIRKGASELRSYKLTNVAMKEIKDSKLDYSEDGNIKTLPYTNFPMFIQYNIKDVLLQMGIERRTNDFDTLYSFSYRNATQYDKAFKQTVKLRNVQYLSFLDQGLIPGENINIMNSQKNPEYEIEKEDDEDDEDFEGALVADPQFNDYVGLPLYGQPTNNIFGYGIDFDMSAFYPSSIMAMNIDPSTLIFKMIMNSSQFDMCGGDLKFHGITGKFFNPEDDASKECIDNFQTGDYMSTGHKWMNLPSLDKIYKRLVKELG